MQKKCALKPFTGEYYIGFYKKLEYRVPVAFQDFIAMIADLEGNIINNIYNKDPKYVIRNISLCIFRLKNSIICCLLTNIIDDIVSFSNNYKDVRIQRKNWINN